MIDVLYYMYYLFYLKKLKDEEPHARTIWFLGIFSLIGYSVLLIYFAFFFCIQSLWNLHLQFSF